MNHSTSRCRTIALSFALAVALTEPFSARADINWDGDNAVGNFSYCDNWYGNSCPGTPWQFSYGNLVFNYHNNSSQASLYYDLSWSDNINDIIWETTFGAGLSLNGNGQGINFNQRVENRSSYAQIVNIPLSGAKNGAGQIELNPVSGDLTISGNLYNDNNKPFYSYGSNSKMLTVGVGLTGNASVSFNIYAGGGGGYGKVKFTAAQTWGDSTHGITLNQGELWLDAGGSFQSGIPITVGAADANTAKFWLSGTSGGVSDGHAITVANAGGIKVLGGLNTSGINTFTGNITLNGSVNLVSDKAGGTLEFKTGVISGGSSINVNNTATSASTVILSSANTYGGGTTVSGGTFLVNGGSTGASSSGTGSGSVTVNSAATLGGTGRIAGNVTFNSGALALFTNGATLTIAGTVALNNNVVHLNLPSNVGAGTYTLATYTSAGSSGSFNTTPVVDSGSFASGTTNYITTSGGNVVLTVQNTTATTLTRTAGNSPSAYGDSLTFHAVISPDPGNGSTISFRTNGVQFGTATTTGGAADFTTSTLPCSGGVAYTVTAAFAGSANYTASTGTLSGGQQVNARPVSLTGTRAYDGTTNATSAILSVANAVGGDTVNVASGTGGLADKNVGTRAITSFGTLALGNNSAGNYTLSGASGSVIITQAVTSVSVGSSENPSGYKDSISFTATLPADATGAVVFKTNTVALSTNSPSTGAAASGSTSALPRGTNTVTAEYAGDSNYLGSTNNLSGGQIVTNHPPVATTMLVQRSADLTLKIALADVATNWSDVDGDSVALSAFNLITTNNINLATNSTWIYYTNGPNVNDQISYSITDGQGGTTTGRINVAIVMTVTGTNSISSVVHNGNSVSLVAHGIPSLVYVTDRSTNLTDWVHISTNTAATNGVISVTDNFTDLGAPPASAYYRLSWTP